MSGRYNFIRSETSWVLEVLPCVGVMSNNQDAESVALCSVMSNDQDAESIALCSVMSNDQYAATNNQ